MKFAFISPRYGAEITSGPAHGARLLAEQLSERHDVDVLTTCASDPSTWRNETSEGVDRVRGVLVRRFAVSEPRDVLGFQQLSDRVLPGGQSRQDEIEWVRRLGPSSPSLVDFLKRQHRNYDVLVFFSLFHATTLQGFPIAPERSVLFPHLQVHPALRFGIWPDLLRQARAIGYFSACERAVGRAFLQIAPGAEEVVGIGIDAAHPQTYPRHQEDPADDPVTDDEVVVEPDEVMEAAYLAGRGVPFRRRHRLDGPFAIYGGRVAANNGSEEMLEHFDAFASADGDTALVLMGVKLMKVPEASYLRHAGVLPDRERMNAYDAAAVTLAPDAGDLLAETVLESLAVGTPVLAAAMNQAAVEHLRRSNGGLYYANREEFVEALRTITADAALRGKMGESGRQYIHQHHRWEVVLTRFERLTSKVKSR
ncbi:MAG: hypothetical protein EXQ59_00845 [Acidobacteria bacterium]|nr:hypothetical protein [Acidobacteriota bacterium]